MDNIDKNIKKILSKNLKEPDYFEQHIRNSFVKKNKNKYFYKIRMIISILGSLLLFGSVVYAGYNMYEKVWKEPRKYNVNEEKPPIISEKEKQQYVTEEIIKEKANKFLAITGYPYKEIKKIEIKRSYEDNSNAYYSTITENEYHNNTRNIGIYLDFNADTGKLEYFLNNDFEYDGINDQLENITESQAINFSKQILNELEWNLDEYEIKTCKMEKNNEWRVEYSKSYNGIYNINDSISIFLGAINNRPIIESISIYIDNAFENNDISITEDEAINIATNKEKALSNIEITNVSAEMGIRKMNTFIYCLENNIEDFSSVKPEDKIRNVWVVEIKHAGGMENIFKIAEGFYGLKQYSDKKYYVDNTTGEIIGGEYITDNYK